MIPNTNEAIKTHCGEKCNFTKGDWEEPCVAELSDINLNGEICRSELISSAK